MSAAKPIKLIVAKMRSDTINWRVKLHVIELSTHFKYIEGTVFSTDDINNALSEGYEVILKP